MSNITKYTRDAFKSLALLEDTDFDLTGKDSFQKIDDFINDDIPVDTEVIDLDAETEEEVKDSYVGDVILDCPVCHTNLFKNIDDVVIDEETNLCCVGEVCPVCGQEDGFTILGKVAPFEEETEEAEVEVTAEPDDFEVDIEDKEEELKEAFRNRKNSRKLQEKVSKRILKNGRNTKSLTEDTVKQNGKWVNKGKEGTHGKFNTKKAADAQRKAMFANGYKEAVETRDVTDQVIVKTSEPGFISKMHELRDQGYERIGSGDGQIIYAKPKILKNESKLTEAPIYDLNPQFDNRNSFYGKAKVDTGDKNDQNKLYSYNTLVAEIKDGKPIVYGTYSQTTLRHIKDWLKQNGFKAENSKQILADYGVKSESLKEEVSDIAYAIADEIDERFANAKFISWDEFNEAFEDACPVTIDWTDDYFNDLETDVRGILSYKGWETIFEGEDEGGLRLLESKSSKHSIDSKILKKFKAKRDESLKEDIEKATIETEDQVIEVKTEEKEPIEEEEVHSEEEMVAPLTDDEIADIEDNSEESVEEDPVEEVEETEEETVESNPEDEEEFDFDEIQEESFKRITESYLKKTYSNIKSFNIEDAKLVENKLTLNGTIEFNSGKKKNTSFVFEKVDDRSTIARNKARFVGLNETFTDKKNAYVLKVRKDDKTLVAESLRYNYPAKTSNLNESVKVVKGLVK